MYQNIVENLWDLWESYEWKKITDYKNYGWRKILVEKNYGCEQIMGGLFRAIRLWPELRLGINDFFVNSENLGIRILTEKVCKLRQNWNHGKTV